MESSRRRNVQESLGITTQKEEQRQQSAIDKELQRQKMKDEKRRQLENDFDYRMVKGISVAFDGYFLDPIIGFFIPGAGDVLTSICAIPFIWVAAARVKPGDNQRSQQESHSHCSVDSDNVCGNILFGKNPIIRNGHNMGMDGYGMAMGYEYLAHAGQVDNLQNQKNA